MTNFVIILLTIVAFAGLSKSNEEIKEEVYKAEPLYIQTYGENKEEKSIDTKNVSVYEVYVFGLNVGEIYFYKKNDQLEVRGETYPSLRFIYNYNFLYIEKGDYQALYEKEKDKERLYENEEIYDKKPWLPLIAKFFKENIKPEEILNLKVYINSAPVIIKKQDLASETVFIFEPQKSKTKRIAVYLNNVDKYPYQIDIEGKVNITLKKVK